MKGRGFLCRRSYAGLKRKLKRSRTKLSWVDGKPFQTSFRRTLLSVFIWILSNVLNWNIRQNVVEICIKPRSCKRKTLNMVSKYLKWYTQGTAASCSMPCCTVFTYKTIIEATFLSKIQAKYLEAQYCVIEDYSADLKTRWADQSYRCSEQTYWRRLLNYYVISCGEEESFSRKIKFLLHIEHINFV